MRYALGLGLLFVTAASPGLATEYHYCISSDRRPANMVAKSGPVDLGKEWYRTRVAQDFCTYSGASACTASDYDAAKCGSLPVESAEYKALNARQIKAIFSGNPQQMGQAAIEVVVGVPVEVFKSGASGSWQCDS